MERIKDFLFDLSDITISLVIIAVIFLVVTWKLNDTMPFSFSLGTENQTETTKEQVTETQALTSPEVVNESSGQEEVTAEAAPVETTALASQGVDVVVSIPSGSTGGSIAKLLLQKGLIDDINAFNKVVADMGLGNKLRAGDFKLNTAMTYEEIAKKLTGQ